MQIYLVAGTANSGKSSLIRCLTGKGNDRHLHPDGLNQKQIAWTTNGQTSTENTLVLNSSLNEPYPKPIDPPRGLQNGIYAHNNIHPLDLPLVLDEYRKIGVLRAVLPISLTVSRPDWTLLDYIYALQKHATNVTIHSIAFTSTPHSQLISAIAQNVPHLKHTIQVNPAINICAKNVRGIFGIV